MKAGYIIICFFIAGLSACKWDRKNTEENDFVKNDTLRYKDTEYKQRAENCGAGADNICTEAKFDYPEFEGQKALNDTISARFAAMFQLTDTPATSMRALAQAFIGEFEKQLAEVNTTMSYALECHARVVRQDSSLTTLETGGYIFTGGAHPSSYTGFINWNTKSNKTIELADIVDPSNIQKFTKVAEGIFRKHEKLSDTASLANHYFFKDDKFAINENFSISPKGLKFVYNQYEIKPYAAGITELLIPYSEIKSLLRPNTVVAQYIK